MASTSLLRSLGAVLVHAYACFILVACGGESDGDSEKAGQDIQVVDSSAGDTASECSVDSDCPDPGDCAVVVCSARACVETALDGKACDDSDVCTVGDRCDEAGVCQPGGPAATTTDPCMTCSCDPITGVLCQPVEVNTPCNDDDCCSTADRCVSCTGESDCGASGLACQGASACDDENACTTAMCTCDGDAPQCTSSAAPAGTSCVFDPNLCTSGDLCTGGVCVLGPPANLDDGNPCTMDVCVKGQIQHTPLASGQCDDGNECTSGDHCFIGNCVGGDPVVCELPLCAGSVACVPGEGCTPAWLPTGATCQSTGECGLKFACTDAHTCEATESVACDDSNACTVDACDPESGECVSTPSDIDCSAPGECLQPECNPASGACDQPVENGTACTGGTCQDGACTCTPQCEGANCGDNGCGGICGVCDDGSSCLGGVCTGCANCPDSCLPNGTCCPVDGFCPTSDTSLSGTHTFSLIHIPAGVTVTCAGVEKLVLNVDGPVTIDGALRADGPDGSASSGEGNVPYCGGSPGGDGYRGCASSSTTYCQTEPADQLYCSELLSPKEGAKTDPCLYLATAPGQPGYGFGGGAGGPMIFPINNSDLGSAAGGGGGSFAGSGSAGSNGQSLCGTKSGGVAGPVGTPSLDLNGGSGGGAGGFTRNGTCGSTCPGGCTGWGGDGGSGGGVIAIEAAGSIGVSGEISARGGAGGEGSSCGGSGGGGSGGVIKLVTGELNVEGDVVSHLLIEGGPGGPVSCQGKGAGGNGGAGHLLLP